MATQGTPLRDVQVIGAPLQRVAGIPVGTLHDVFVLTRATVSDVTGPNLNNRFPTPPSAFGFLTEVRDADFELPYVIHGITPPYVINGALTPAGQYLEPTIGQIWPRVG